MSTSTRTTLVAVALIATGLTVRTGVARACGPDFDSELLSQRTSTLLELQPRSFLSEIQDLVPAPTVHYTVLFGAEPDGVRTRGSPQERALYERGAAAFTASDYDGARDAFVALLALPRAQRVQRSTWAAYMLGRTYDAQYDEARAIAAYRQVRSLVADGFVDELGLAAGSLGQEARDHYRADDVVTAVHLYAEQDAQGHPYGGPSLQQIASLEADNAGGHRRALLADPLGQRLLATYLATRGDDMTPEHVEDLWNTLAAVPSIAGADQLAGAAYRAGRWELADRFARQAPHAKISASVLAKLALRAGDRATADRLLAEVATTMTTDAAGCTETSETRLTHAHVHDERAILALAADHPVDAMAEAYAARGDYPLDAAYIAERVLTIDELHTFVDALPPPVLKPPVVHAGSDDDDGDTWDIASSSDIAGGRVMAASWLPELLARRLMRIGRFWDAMPYFEPAHRELAMRFAIEMVRSRATDDAIDHARVLYDASLIARHDGLEILGTEGAPDWAIYGANYDPRAIYEDDPDDDGSAAKQVPDPLQPTADEAARVAASAPAFARRYHYRYLASHLAEQAADLLPHRSQAFAASLCVAAREIHSVDGTRYSALYYRYLKQGPTVEFSGTFGQDCPAPEFEGARRFVRPSMWRAPLHVRWRRRYSAALAMLVLGALGFVTTRVGRP